MNVLNGATCNATTTSGRDQKPGELKLGQSGGGLGKSSLYLAVNPKTNTLYATNVIWAAQDAHTVYVLDGATCDAADHAGCGQKPATITVGDDPRAPAVDPGTDTVYIPNHAAGDYAATVSVIDGAACNSRHGGCRKPPVKDAVGNYPSELAVHPGAGSAYVANSDNTVSVLPLAH